MSIVNQLDHMQELCNQLLDIFEDIKSINEKQKGIIDTAMTVCSSKEVGAIDRLTITQADITKENYPKLLEESDLHKPGCVCNLCDAVKDYEYLNGLLESEPKIDETVL